MLNKYLLKFSWEKVQDLSESLIVVVAVKDTLVPPVNQDVSDLLHSLVLTELHRGVVSAGVIGGLDDHQHYSIILQVYKYNIVEPLVLVKSLLWILPRSLLMSETTLELLTMVMIAGASSECSSVRPRLVSTTDWSCSQNCWCSPDTWAGAVTMLATPAQ